MIILRKAIRRGTLSLVVAITGVILMARMLFIHLNSFPNKEYSTGLNRSDVNYIPKATDHDRKLSKAHLNSVLTRKRPPVDCSLLIKDNPNERVKAIRFQDANTKNAITESEYIKMTQDCHKFVAENHYYMSSPLPGEEDFPLAFSILMYRDIEQFERLLRAIYRPLNVYCVHVDKKSRSILHLAVRSISRCLDNVFVLENHVDVTWGTYTALEPDILCMEALLKYKKWKYFINLTGQEFPLKTNWELVQILKAINGSNLVAATRSRDNPERFKGRPPPPIPVRVYKGSVHVLVRREFVEYAIKNDNGRIYSNWLKLIGVPDEYFFSTLNHNPQLNIPGSYLGIPETNNGSYHYPYINRLKTWKSNNTVCKGKFVRSICIFGVGDLPRLGTSRSIFANKFHLDYHPIALDCLEELIYNRTLAELRGIRIIDVSFYRNLQVAKNHI